MLKVTIPAQSRWDDNKEEFVETKKFTFEIEHSLLSLSEWEAKYKRPFLDQNQPKTASEMLDYIHMMCLDKTIEIKDLVNLTPENVREIKEYIDEKRTATTLSKEQLGKPSREIITSELIYCWMVQQQIPFEVEKWHLSRILMLINVVSIKNQPPKKSSPIDTMKNHAALNKARRASYSKPRIPKH